MERPNAWKDYTAEQLDELHYLCEGYKAYISDNKTAKIAAGEALKPGDKVYAVNRGKALMLVNMGTDPLEQGVNILGAHIDSPRLDVKQNPMEEKSDLLTLDTHYYGGIKKYQWVTIPLAIRGCGRGPGGPSVLRLRPANPPRRRAAHQGGLQGHRGRDARRPGGRPSRLRQRGREARG